MGLGEIRLVAFKYAPRGWALCDGAPLQIQEHRGLYDEIKTKYGGDGRTTFALPDLRGRALMHRADGAALGTKGKISVDAARPNHHHGRVALNFIIALTELDMGDTPFVGEVRPFGFNFAPVHWARCDGALLEIASNETLYFLIESAFGGGDRHFAVPDLREAHPFQPANPEDRGKTGGAWADGDTPQQAPLLAVNYCIATGGLFPPRP